MDSIRTPKPNYLGQYFLINSTKAERTSKSVGLIDTCITRELHQDPTQVRMNGHVLNLAQASRSSTNPANTKRALQYIAAVLLNIGYQPTDTLYQRFTHYNRDTETVTPQANLVLRLGNPNGKQIIVGAHYDSEISSPGADDNASSIAVLLELARKLKPYEHQLKDSEYGIQIAFWGNEEYPLNRQRLFNHERNEDVIRNNMGSHKFADYLRRKNTNIDQVFCLDMVGLGTGLYGLNNIGYRDETLKDLIKAIRKSETILESAKEIELNLQFSENSSPIINHPKQALLHELRSDHRNFIDQNCIFITNSSYNPNYHAPSDRHNTLDYLQMEKLCQVLASTVLKHSELTPPNQQTKQS